MDLVLWTQIRFLFYRTHQLFHCPPYRVSRTPRQSNFVPDTETLNGIYTAPNHLWVNSVGVRSFDDCLAIWKDIHLVGGEEINQLPRSQLYGDHICLEDRVQSTQGLLICHLLASDQKLLLLLHIQFGAILIQRIVRLGDDFILPVPYVSLEWGVRTLHNCSMCFRRGCGGW